MANFNMFGLQDASSYLMEYMSFFHDMALLLLMFILSIVFYVILTILMNKVINKFLSLNESIEIFWTLIPGMMLAILALPSLKVLYMSDEILYPSITVKAIGQQWYWSYEYSDYQNINFQSYMLGEVNLNEVRLLEVDNRLVIPLNVSTRVIVTSSDVIHSWSVPSLGVKVDANPGRLNQCHILSNRIGLFYGQCSEMCGALHSYMPICVEITDMSSYKSFLRTK